MTSAIIWIVIAFAVFQGVSGMNVTSECASAENVTALDAVVDAMNQTLQAYLQNVSALDEFQYYSILNFVCEDQMLLQDVRTVEQYVVSCPDIVMQSKVTALELGPLKFLDLLTDFQSVDHFCECEPLLLQVLAIEITKSNILYNDSGAYYPEIIDLAVICNKTSSPSPVNFTMVAELVRDHKRECQAVFSYSTIDIQKMQWFILLHCEDFSPENFTCALNYTQDEEMNTCLDLVDQSVTTPTHDRPIVFDINDCRRGDCVKELMAGCTQNGLNAYMWAVNFRQPQREIQFIACDIGGASGLYSNLVLVAMVTCMLRL